MLRDPGFAHLNDDELLDLLDELWDSGDTEKHDKAYQEAARRKLVESF